MALSLEGLCSDLHDNKKKFHGVENCDRMHQLANDQLWIPRKVSSGTREVLLSGELKIREFMDYVR